MPYVQRDLYDHERCAQRMTLIADLIDEVTGTKVTSIKTKVKNMTVLGFIFSMPRHEKIQLLSRLSIDQREKVYYRAAKWCHITKMSDYRNAIDLLPDCIIKKDLMHTLSQIDINKNG